MKFKPHMLRLIYALYVIALCMLMTVDVHAADCHFRQLAARQGLSSSTVNAMLVDSRGFLWIGTSMGLNRYDGYEIRSFRYFDDERKFPAANVRGLQEDAEKNIWIEYDGETACYDIKNHTFVTDNRDYYKSLGITLPKNYKMTVDSRGNLWFVSDGMIQYYDYGSKRLEKKKINLKIGAVQWHLADCAEGLYLTNEQEVWKYLTKTGTVQKIVLPQEMRHPDSRLRIYVDTENTLWVYSMVNESIYHYRGAQLQLPSGGGSNAMRAIYDDGRGRLWIATDHNGVFVYNRQNGAYQHIQHQQNDMTSLSSDNVTCITADRQGTIWLGHLKTGVSFSNSHYSLFQSCGLQFGDISTMQYDRYGNLWLGTDGNGVFVEHSDKSSVKAALPNITISSFLEDHNGTMWVGTYNNGLYKMNGTAVAKSYSSDNGMLPHNAVWQMAEDNHHNIWIGSGFAPLTKFSLDTEKALPVSANNSAICGLSLAFDGKHTMYVGTYYGVWAFDTNTGKGQCYLGNRKNTQQLLNPSIVSLCYDRKRDMLWVAHMTGISVMDIKRDTLYYFNDNNGLFDNYVKSIVQDRKGNVWLSTDHGISCVQMVNNGEFAVHNFMGNEDLQNTYFNTFAAVCSPNGDILLGGNEGYTKITPSSVFANHKAPQLSLTEVLVGDRSVLHDGNEVDLAYDDHQITFKFFTGDLVSASRVLYAYRLKGVSSDWIYTDKNSISFFNLAYGHYTLEIKASDENGEWGEVLTVKVNVAPPFALSWFMIVVYLLAIIALAVLIYRRIKMRQQQRIEEQRCALEQGQQVQISEMKLRFFTNISHDLRTPLTLIISPLQSLIEEMKKSDVPNAAPRNLRSRLDVIYKNAQLLYSQVNMLLDFRRLDVGAETLKLQSIDVAQYVNSVCLSFHDYAEERSITLIYKPSSQHIFVSVDAEKLNKIMYNLLSNAFKFTPDGGTIIVDMSQQQLPDDATDEMREKWDGGLLIKVCDTGCGIADADKKRIFSRFYQVRNDDPKAAGSGIGLHIVNEYVKMHGGTIVVKDNVPQGSVFVVNLPVAKAEEKIEEMYSDEQPTVDDNALQDNAKQGKEKKNITTILVVDDNHDLCSFIADSLVASFSEAAGYCIIKAYDGAEALKVLETNDVTLVVTDIMMPNIDGMELCRRIKTNIKWSHIPVIMLTAKSTDVSIVEGLKLGADDYITKPFNVEHLRLRIEKFLEWTKTSHETFQRKIEVEPSEITITSLDEEFVKKAIQLVEDNISDSDFTVEVLGKALCMSRANLYKKMMSITGIGPHEFIRSIRLKRAHQLLEKSQKQIAEIAYEVGFSSPKRFSENFKAEFGVTPSEFMRKKKQ